MIIQNTIKTKNVWYQSLFRDAPGQVTRCGSVPTLGQLGTQLSREATTQSKAIGNARAMLPEENRAFLKQISDAKMYVRTAGVQIGNGVCPRLKMTTEE